MQIWSHLEYLKRKDISSMLLIVFLQVKDKENNIFISKITTCIYFGNSDFELARSQLI